MIFRHSGKTLTRQIIGTGVPKKNLGSEDLTNGGAKPITTHCNITAIPSITYRVRSQKQSTILGSAKVEVDYCDARLKAHPPTKRRW